MTQQPLFHLGGRETPRFHRLSACRPGVTEPELLAPERIYEVALDLSVTSNVFLPSHRIRLLLPCPTRHVTLSPRSQAIPVLLAAGSNTATQGGAS